MWARLRSRARALLGRRRFEDDLTDELAFHLQARTDHWIAQGMNRSEAARRARLEFGSPDKHAEACRESRGLRLVDELAADLRYGLRQLRRAPAFTLVATLTLALAIGANAAIFSLVDAVLIKTLPVAEPQQLRQLSWVGARNETSLWNGIWYNGGGKLRGPSQIAATSFSYVTCDAIRRHTNTFSDVLCLGDIRRVNIGVGGRAVLGRGQLVPGNFFSGLRLGMHLGRAIAPEDDRAGQPPVAVLGYGFWERALGADPGVLGRTLTVNGVTVTIVGVAARGFAGLQPGELTDVFLPLVPLQPAFYSEPDMLSSPRYWNWLVVGRLKPGVDPEHARQESEQLLRQELMARPTSATPLDMPRLELDGIRPRLRSTARVVRQTASRARADRGGRAAHRVRQHRGPAAHTRERASARVRDALVARRRARTPGPPVADRERAARGHGRRGWDSRSPSRCGVCCRRRSTSRRIR